LSYSLDEISENFAKIEDEYLHIQELASRNAECPEDGKHFAPKGSSRPLSVSHIEAKFFFNLVSLTQPNNVLEIGTGFGYSSSWMAAAMRHSNTRGMIFTVDDWSEGDPRINRMAIASDIWTTLGISEHITQLVGTSPHIIENTSLPQMNLIFIDGNHRGDQPVADYHACKRLLFDRTLVLFHDAQARYGVDRAIELAQRDGFSIMRLNTSCEPCIAYKSLEGKAYVEHALGLAYLNKLVSLGDKI